MADHQHAPISAAFEQIEDVILPCITMMLDSLLDCSAQSGSDPRAFAAAVRDMADDLVGLTQLIERNPAAGLVGGAGGRPADFHWHRRAIA